MVRVMATRKQRSRRAKTFRHEYGIVDYDEEGNEVELTASELRARKNKPAKAGGKQAAQAKGRGGRSASTRRTREPPPPSWDRAIRRGVLWGGMMLVVVVVFFKGMPLASRILVGIVYAGAFVPLTYLIDRFAYNNFLRRRDKAAGSGSGSGKTP